MDRQFSVLFQKKYYICIRFAVSVHGRKMSMYVGKIHVHVKLSLEYTRVKVTISLFGLQYDKVQSFPYILKPI